MKKNAAKVLRRTKEKCPDCDANGLSLIIRKETKEGVTYSKKYLYCFVCEYIKEFKEKGKNKKFSDEDGELENDKHDSKRSTVNRNSRT
jgi:hypothetical protein